MSYAFKLYVPGKSVPDNKDHRLATIGYKKPKDAPADYKVPPTLCISVPKLVIDVTPAVLAAPLQKAWESLQTDLLRHLVESQPASQRLNYAVNGEEIGFTAVASFLATQGGRLDGDTIETWFDANVADKLLLAFAEKQGCDENTPKDDPRLTAISAAIANQRTLLKKLAGPQTRYDETVTTGLLATLDKCASSDDELAGKLRARLESFKTQTKPELLLSLG